MSKSKLFSIITIACFVSILCIPLGIVLMLYYTSWKKKTKIILSISLTAFYAALLAFVFLIKPAYNTGGISLPFGSNSGYTAFDSGSSASGKSNGGKSSGGVNKKNTSDSTERLPKKVQQGQKKVSSSVLYPILFFLFMLFLIVWQNIRNKGKSSYENPYVDTNKYKLPLAADAKMPMVHFLHVDLNEGEKIYFATETNQSGNEGNFVITNQRVVILAKTQNEEFAVDTVTAVSSATNTVMVITAQEKKYYIFMPESQMKYSLAVLKWAAKITQDNPGVQK